MTSPWCSHWTPILAQAVIVGLCLLPCSPLKSELPEDTDMLSSSLHPQPSGLALAGT